MHRLLLVFFGVLIVASVASVATADSPSNIVYILADDMGYGDIKALNPECKIKTPNLDKLAAEGMVFTDAHSSSSVCTPTRYGILTGRYNWRSRMKSGVLGGFSKRLIEPDRLTVASLLKQHNYHTACVGKWHLGMDWTLKAGGIADSGSNGGWDIDYTKAISNGPLAVGFDQFFGISASLDMPPYVYIRDNKTTVVPTVEGKGFGRKGPAAEGLTPQDVLPDLTKEAVTQIGNRAKQSDKPFFLYFPLPAPHTPIAPTKQWQGKSGLNEYADFVMQVDDTVGQVMKALQDNALAENTLLVFTCDNGCSPRANFDELAQKGHNPSHIYRGHKADIFDGGHRVPFICRWPGIIKPGTTNHQLICLTDLMATCADIVGATLADSAGEDSVSILPALRSNDDQPLREAVVHHSIRGAFSIRQGKWKLELCPGSGGWSSPRPGKDDMQGLPLLQLYNLHDDAAESNNVQAEHPEIVQRLTLLLQSYADRGRSTAGKTQPNNGEVNIRLGQSVPKRPKRRK